ncbi:MAG TPA: hypothetical protein VN408_14790 [Actinoplanes sp.]|nr:hypothetical protein [Actinoplanes sp.]
MPVSRKRKKSQKSTTAARAERRRSHAQRVRLTSSLAAILTAQEEGAARRVDSARPHAAGLTGDLLASAQTGTALEDEICARLGPLLAGLGAEPIDTFVGPDHLAQALIEDLRERGDEPRVTEVRRAVAAIMPLPLRESIDADVTTPETAGEVLWTRDRYGSRFAIVAPLTTPDGPVRWYLWDVEAGDFTPRPAHAGFYASPEEALAAWQVAAGGFAAGGTSWRRIDDSRLLAALLPKPERFGPLGGETAGQFAEYHRCRRLAEVLLTLPRVLAFDPVRTALDDGPAAFGAWLRTRPEYPVPEMFLIEELFEVWPSEVEELFDTCSPHRVASAAAQLDDDLRELLPAWVTWLAERTRLPAELRDRSLAVLSAG